MKLVTFFAFLFALLVAVSAVPTAETNADRMRRGLTPMRPRNLGRATPVDSELIQYLLSRLSLTLVNSGKQAQTFGRRREWPDLQFRPRPVLPKRTKVQLRWPPGHHLEALGNRSRGGHRYWPSLHADRCAWWRRQPVVSVCCLVRRQRLTQCSQLRTNRLLQGQLVQRSRHQHRLLPEYVVELIRRS